MRLSLAGRVAVALSLLSLAAPAAAEGNQSEPTGDAGRPIVETFVQLDRVFWQARGVQPRADLTVSVVTDPCGQEDAYGCVSDGLGGRLIEVRASVVRAAARERYQPGAGGDSQRLVLCTTIAHEEGHTAGLEHTLGGVMDERTSAAPFACRAWVARAERVERAATGRAARSARRRARSMTG